MKELSPSDQKTTAETGLFPRWRTFMEGLRDMGLDEVEVDWFVLRAAMLMGAKTVELGAVTDHVLEEARLIASARSPGARA